MTTSQKLAVGVKEAALMVSLPASTIWVEVASERLRSFKVGRRRLIKVSDLSAWLDRRELLSASLVRLPVPPAPPTAAAARGRRSS